MRLTVHRLLFAVIFALTGCQGSDRPISPRPAVTLVSASINPLNSLSTTLTLASSFVDSVRIRYSTSDKPEETTPFVHVSGALTQLTALGLSPSTLYTQQVEAFGPGGQTVVGPFMIATGALPTQLAAV